MFLQVAVARAEYEIRFLAAEVKQGIGNDSSGCLIIVIDSVNECHGHLCGDMQKNVFITLLLLGFFVFFYILYSIF